MQYPTPPFPPPFLLPFVEVVDFLASLSASVPKRRFGWVDLPERNGRRAIVVVTRSWFGLLPDSHRTQSGWLTHFHRLFLEIRHVLGDISLTQAGGRGQGADVSPFKPFSPSRVQVREVIAGRVCCVVMTASLCLVNVCDTNRYMDVLYDRVSLSRSDLDPCPSPSPPISCHSETTIATGQAKGPPPRGTVHAHARPQGISPSNCVCACVCVCGNGSPRLFGRLLPGQANSPLFRFPRHLSPAGQAPGDADGDANGGRRGCQGDAGGGGGPLADWQRRRGKRLAQRALESACRRRQCCFVNYSPFSIVLKQHSNDDENECLPDELAFFFFFQGSTNATRRIRPWQRALLLSAFTCSPLQSPSSSPRSHSRRSCHSRHLCYRRDHRLRHRCHSRSAHHTHRGTTSTTGEWLVRARKGEGGGRGTVR